MDLNTIAITAKATKDAELRYTSSGSAVAKFRVRVFNGKRGDTFKNVFLDVEVWGNAAEFVANNVTNGVRVGVAGRLECDETEKDGQKRQWWKIANANVTLIDKAQNNGNGGTQFDDDDPFPS